MSSPTTKVAPETLRPGDENGADIEPQETREWLDSLASVIEHDGPDRARYLLGRLVGSAARSGAYEPHSGATPYVNTIPAETEPPYPGDEELEYRIASLIRWNSMAMVLQANKESSELGGHLATYQSVATLYEVGFNHFWHAPSESHGGDLVMFQGHSSPGCYGRAFLEGRLSEAQLRRYRQEVDERGRFDGGGICSYPHPWLMPDFWQFPTASMGLGPLMGIYQARFMKYLEGRELAETEGRKVWVFCGDGEMDEPESLGAISLAGREKLDNLIFVVNCNLQRLDGPVRGNGKIIQELETVFRGAGWNVIKVIWGSRWDPLLAADKEGFLVRRMEEVVDGEYQTYKANNGAYVREHFFGRNEPLRQMVADMSDEDLFALNRGGHDARKVYAAYAAAVQSDRPTVILAKTVKGYGMGEAGEGQNITHQQKKMTEAALLKFRDRFELDLTDEQVRSAAFVRPPESSPEMRYLAERRAALGGSLPARRAQAEALQAPDLSAFGGQLVATGDREISTTMAYVRILSTLLRDKKIGRHIVPIVPDESRTFGMEGMFRQFGIFSQVGQLYRPHDADQLMFYKEDKKGQLLQEGINEAGALSSWIAAGTSYSNHGVPMIPFFTFYSIFGMQRVGDLVWAAGDSRARGFLIGGTAGRTTLNGEGLQHEDGHSHVLSSIVPNCISYDPAYGYELAVIIQEGLRRMLTEREDVFYYITVMNENYPHPAMPEGAEEAILKGMYLLREGEKAKGKKKLPHVQLLGSGTILREVLAGAELLREDFGVSSDVWSVTSFTELRREGLETERWNMLHPTEAPRLSHVEQCLADREGPVVAASDYLRSFADQIRPFVDRRYAVLGTDGYGRSDYRAKLRRFFEVDRHYVALAALKALADEGAIEPEVVAQAIERYGIDADKPIPTRV